MSRSQMIERAKKEIIEDMKKHSCKRCMVRVNEGEEFCPKCKKIQEVDMVFHRKKTRLHNETQIKNIQREIEFKATQVKSGDIQETRFVKIADSGQPTIIDGYKDNLKPKHILENEIDDLKARQDLFKEQLRALNQAEEEDVRRTSSDGDQGEASS